MGKVYNMSVEKTLNSEDDEGNPVTDDDISQPALFLSEFMSELSLDSSPDILKHLSLDEYRMVADASQKETFQSGDNVFLQGDRHSGIFIIEKGTVRTFYTSPAGREITLAYWPPGNFVGGPEVFGRGYHLWAGVAESEVRTLKLGGTVLQRLIEKIPALAIGIIGGLSFKGKCYSALIHMLGTRSVTGRLAQLLMIMADLDGDDSDDGLVITRMLTHEALANMVGSTRQWVTMTMDRFQKKGVIRVDGKRVTITDSHRLSEMAN